MLSSLRILWILLCCCQVQSHGSSYSQAQATVNHLHKSDDNVAPRTRPDNSTLPNEESEQKEVSNRLSDKHDGTESSASQVHGESPGAKRSHIVHFLPESQANDLKRRIFDGQLLSAEAQNVRLAKTGLGNQHFIAVSGNQEQKEDKGSMQLSSGEDRGSVQLSSDEDMGSVQLSSGEDKGSVQLSSAENKGSMQLSSGEDKGSIQLSPGEDKGFLQLSVQSSGEDSGSVLSEDTEAVQEKYCHCSAHKVVSGSEMTDEEARSGLRSHKHQKHADHKRGQPEEESHGHIALTSNKNETEIWTQAKQGTSQGQAAMSQTENKAEHEMYGLQETNKNEMLVDKGHDEHISKKATRIDSAKDKDWPVRTLNSELGEMRTGNIMVQGRVPQRKARHKTLADKRSRNQLNRSFRVFSLGDIRRTDQHTGNNKEEDTLYRTRRFATGGTSNYTEDGLERRQAIAEHCRCRICNRTTAAYLREPFENVAYDKPATASSYHPYVPPCIVTNGFIDNNVITSDDDKSPFFQIDLEYVITFSKLVIYRKDENSTRERDKQLMMALDVLIDGRLCYSFPNYTDGYNAVRDLPHGIPIQCTFTRARAARYVRLQKRNETGAVIPSTTFSRHQIVINNIEIWVCKPGFYGEYGTRCTICPERCGALCNNHYGCAFVTHNVAILKNASQSSTATGDPNNVVDGIPPVPDSLDTCTQFINSSENKMLWWRVDLTAVFKIYSVAITGRSDCCGPENLRNFTIWVTRDTTVASQPDDQQCVSRVQGVETGQRVDLNCTNPVIGRYVWVVSRGVLAFCEFEAFGHRYYELPLGSPCTVSSYFGVCDPDTECSHSHLTCKTKLFGPCTDSNVCTDGAICDLNKCNLDFLQDCDPDQSGCRSEAFCENSTRKCKSSLFSPCTDSDVCMDGAICNLNKCKMDFLQDCDPDQNECRSEAFCENSTRKCICILGMYGPTCEEHCGNCAQDQPCNSSTGECHRCQSGWSLPLCQFNEEVGISKEALSIAVGVGAPAVAGSALGIFQIYKYLVRSKEFIDMLKDKVGIGTEEKSDESDGEESYDDEEDSDEDKP